MPAPNIHGGDPFSLESLTAAINNQPYRPGQVSASGLFEEDSVTTVNISIEYKDGKLGLVNTSERGGSGDTTDDEKRRKVPFLIDHYQRDDDIFADEVQGVRAFGSENEAEILEERVNSRAGRHAADLTMTLEHQRVGALKGIVTEKSGSVLHDLYNIFSIAVPSPISLELDVEATNVGKLVQDVGYSIEDDLDGASDGLHAFTGRDFHRFLWWHKSVVDTRLNHSGASVLRAPVPDTFDFGPITFERYKTGAKATADLGAAYIAADEARVVPKGVPGLFITRFAPGDYIETINTPGLPFYSRATEKPNGKGYDLEVQMNAISLCTNPAVLRKLTLT